MKNSVFARLNKKSTNSLEFVLFILKQVELSVHVLHFVSEGI